MFLRYVRTFRGRNEVLILVTKQEVERQLVVLRFSIFSRDC